MGGLVEVQEGSHNQVPPIHHLNPLSHHLPPSRSSPLLPHPPPTTGDSGTMTVMALTWVWITVMSPSRSVSAWNHPKRKERALSNLSQWSRRHTKSVCQVVHQQQAAGRGGNVGVDVGVDLTELSMPRVLEEVARKILQKPEWEGLHARPRQAKYVRPEFTSPPSRPPALTPNNLGNATAPSGKEASPMTSP